VKDNQDISSRKLIDRLVPDRIWGPMHGLLATTYELRPDFLEMDFLPSIFGLGAWDDRSWATRIALEKRLFELDAAVIFTEARRYRGRPRSLRLEVRPVVCPRGSALHAKVTLLLYDRAVRLIVGSANLTEQGYRRNREVVAVLTASQGAKKEASLISQALAGMDLTLAPWFSIDARKIIRRSLETLQPWLGGDPDPDTTFLWTHSQTRLWREFLGRWPVGEPVKRISILSPFWSEDAGLTLISFLAELKKGGTLAADAEVRLLTDAFKGPDGKFIPILPLGYAAYDWTALGVRATAQAVSPEVHPDELGGMEGFTGVRALHAKVVLMEGARNGLAYLGSANFTAHGWGFLGHDLAANVEAGLILRRSLQAATFDRLLPDLVGQPILLSNANVHTLQAPESGSEDDPWPEFIQQVLLSPCPSDENHLQLLIEVAPSSAPLLWSAKLLDKDGMPGETLVPVEATQNPSKMSFSIPLSSENLTRLLTEQEILICWIDCLSGRAVPLNVESSARNRLPISPSTQRIEETLLLSYYQGRIAWEELFPDPDLATGQGGSPAAPAACDAGVDKSRIQSYQIREFVEALTGLRQDLQLATQSEPSMRLALLGPVSPIALATSILEAVKSSRRTPTAAAFQLVEILSCLNSARSFDVPEKLSQAWQQHLGDTFGKTSRLLEQLLSAHCDTLASNKAFGRYQKAVLAGGPRLNT
jgi:phosphatidylserine/phosphatidylglycerophosphate/cardiolipin synthase-like enzyme